MTEIAQHIGVLGIVRSAANDASILFPLYCEGKKQEIVRGYGSQLQPLTPSMLEMVSGAIETGDTSPADALQREMLEERNIRGIKVVGPLKQTLEASQVRGDKSIDFLVTMFLITLSREQQELLTQRYGAVAYMDEYFVNSLDMIDEKQFRPLAWAALRAAITNNFWKQ